LGFKVLFKLNDNSIDFEEKVFRKDRDVFILRTISPVQVVTNKDFNDHYEAFVRHIELMSEHY